VLPRLLNDDRVPLTETHPELGPLAEVVERCLSADPDARYATATALDHALQSFDPSPAQTLAEWTRPSSIDTLVLAPDPVLDAPRTRGATMATMRDGRRRGPPVAPPAIAEVSRPVAAPASTNSRLSILILFLVAAAVAAGVVVSMASDDGGPPPGPTREDASVAAAPVRPVAVDPIDAGPGDADVGESVVLAETQVDETEREDRRPRDAPPRGNTFENGHAEAVKVRFVVTQSDQPFERVRAALLAGHGALATCYATVGEDVPTRPTNGTARMSSSTNATEAAEGEPELHRCVRDALIEPFGHHLAASGTYSVVVRYWVRASSSNEVEVADIADRPDSHWAVDVATRVLAPSVWSRGELTDQISHRMDDVDACLNGIATPPTRVHVSEVELTFQGGVAPQTVLVTGSTYNLSRPAHDCVYGPLTRDIRLPARPDPDGGILRFRVTITPEAPD